jgi:hypothetical protein
LKSCGNYKQNKFNKVLYTFNCQKYIKIKNSH